MSQRISAEKMSRMMAEDMCRKVLGDPCTNVHRIMHGLKPVGVCKRCGEPKDYAKQFGCPVADPKCPHDKKVRAELKREIAAHKRKAKKSRKA